MTVCDHDIIERAHNRKELREKIAGIIVRKVLREKIAGIIVRKVLQEDYDDLVEGYLDEILMAADAILDLIQSERAEPRVSILDTFFHGNNANGQPVFSGHADGVTNITLHGWTCFGPDKAGQKALAGFQSERAG